MFQSYIDMYKTLVQDAYSDTIAVACIRIVESLLYHALCEHDIESVREDVKLMRDAAVTQYHAASTDYGKGQATMQIDTYAFFLYLTQNPPSELPFH